MPYINVDIDASEVLPELDTDDLVKELRKRSKKGDEVAVSALSELDVAERDARHIRDLVQEGAAHELLCFFDRLFYAKDAERLSAAYRNLPRDPDSGRPVIQ